MLDGRLFGWASFLDGRLFGWASLLDGCLCWIGFFVGWASSLDGLLRWMGVLPGLAPLLDPRTCEFRVFADLAPSLVQCPRCVVAWVLRHICIGSGNLASSRRKCMPLVYSHVLHVAWKWAVLERIMFVSVLVGECL